MKIVEEAEPFDSNENGVDSEEDGVVEFCVSDLGGEHDEKG